MRTKLSIFYKTSFCFLAIIVLALFVPFTVSAQCSAFQLSFGDLGNERAIDIAGNADHEFYVSGITESFGNAKEIFVTKHKKDGSLLWSKTYGFSKDESVRKISTTKDGGLLVVGQTKSQNNSNGDILCFKIDGRGKLLWSTQFGVSSLYGDLGMDIIETTDGGAAVTGILDVVGGRADMVIFKLNSSANVVWSKRFDRGDGEDGVGILQKGDTLIVASDLQNSSAHYEMQVMKMKLSDGSFIMSKKLSPAERGLFNPYLFKNPNGAGYFISGHTIDKNLYDNMKHTIVSLDVNFNITNTTTIDVSPVNNDFYTGFVPLKDGSFITTGTPHFNADGFVYRVDKNNKLQYAQKLNKSSDLRLYRSIALDQQLIAVGSVVQNGQEDMFITGFPLEGMPKQFCDAENVNARIGNPVFTVSEFTWPTISDANLQVAHQMLVVKDVNMLAQDLCPKNACDSISIKGPDKICSNSNIYEYDIYRAARCTQPFVVDVDANYVEVIKQTDISLQVKYIKEGQTSIKMSYVNDCGIVADQLDINIKFSPSGIDLGKDATTCNDTSFVLKAGEGFSSYIWQDGNSHATYSVKAPGMFHILTANICGETFRDTLVYTKSIAQKFTVNATKNAVCKGDSVVFNATGGQIYNWQPAAAFKNINNSSSSAIVSASTNFSVQITDSVCSRDTAMVVPVTAIELPVIKISKSNDLNCSLDSALLIAKGAEVYNWMPDNSISRMGLNNITVKPNKSTAYYVEGRDAYGCVGRDSLTVQFFKTGNQNIHVPTAFTPNGDGRNELFRPFMIGGAQQFDFRIYNRWGELIFKTNTVSNGWNGNKNNSPQPEGIYIYYIKAEGICSGLFEQKGTFLLTR